MNNQLANDVEAILNDLYPKQQYSGDFITIENTVEGLRGKVVADEETEITVCNKNLLEVVKSVSTTAPYSDVVRASYYIIEGKTYILSFNTENTGKQCYIDVASGLGFSSSNMKLLSGNGILQYFYCEGNKVAFLITCSTTGFYSDKKFISNNDTSGEETGYITDIMLEMVDDDVTEASDYVGHQEQVYSATETEIKTYSDVTHIYNCDNVNMTATTRIRR